MTEGVDGCEGVAVRVEGLCGGSELGGAVARARDTRQDLGLLDRAVLQLVIRIIPSAV